MALGTLRFRSLLTNLSHSVRRDAGRLLSRMSHLAAYESREFITDAWPELLRPYIDAAGELTAEWYDGQPSTNTVFVPQPADPPPDEQLGANGRWAIGQDDPHDALGGTGERAVFNASRDTVLDNVIREGGARWVREARPGACSFCKLMTTRGAVYYTEQSALTVVGRTIKGSQIRPGETSIGGEGGFRGTLRGTRNYGESYHDECVPAGTLVSGPSTESAYRRLYEGESVVISTASGQKLTITPNHPVLTDQGWVPAGLINEGDYVVRSLSSDAGAAAVPHEHQRPALIEDVWGSLAVNGLVGVPGSAENFHGDGSDREVEIVWSDRDLSPRPDASTFQHAEELFLTAALGGGPRPSLAIARESAALLPRSLSATRGCVCGAGERHPFFGGRLVHPNGQRRSARARIDSHFSQASSNHDPLGFENTGAFKLGELLIDVELTEEAGVDRQPVRARFDPAGFEFTAKGIGAYASLGRSLMDRLSGHVELDRVVESKRISFSGHVYNLQTENGWYSANSVIVSNCRCLAVMIRPGDTYTPPEYAQGWNQDYIDATADAEKWLRNQGIDRKPTFNDILNAMDRAERARNGAKSRSPSSESRPAQPAVTKPKPKVSTSDDSEFAKHQVELLTANLKKLRDQGVPEYDKRIKFYQRQIDRYKKQF